MSDGTTEDVLRLLAVNLPNVEVVRATTEDRHLLFHGELSDAPGRNESWNDFLRYRGNNRWELINEGTDFSGISDAEPMKEPLSTRALVNWVLERDAEIDDGLSWNADDQDEADENDPPRQLGPYGRRLREIATTVDAPYCVLCLDRWLTGSWPPEKKQRAVTVLDIKGVTRRGAWIRIYHKVFDVETNLGPAFLYPPDAARTARLVLKSEGSISAGRIVKVSNALVAKIDALKPAFDLLKEEY